MKKTFLFFILSVTLSLSKCFSQTLPVLSTHNYGTLESVSTLQSDFRFVNHGNKTVFVLIVNAGENISWQKPNGIAAGDTGILKITFEPTAAGSFSESIKVFLSDSNKSVELHMSGNIKHIDNAMLHCAKFNEPNSYQPTAPLITFTTKQNPDSPPDEIIVMREPTKSDSIILNQPISENEIEVPAEDFISTPELPVTEFAANNIVFVVDVSSSMLTDDKIEPMKDSTQLLMNQMRGIDRVAIVSFNTGA